jgi:hypothetical protein
VCPACGSLQGVPEVVEEEVIEVEARPVGGQGEGQNTYAMNGEGSAYGAGGEASPEQGPRIFRFEQQRVGGTGCCNCGCLLFAVFVFFAIRGIISLFS